MRIRLPDDDARDLNELLKRARRSRTLSASAWIRGAVNVARGDHEVASRIVNAAPKTGHGGQRPGAGRPKQIAREEGTRGRHEHLEEDQDE